MIPDTNALVKQIQNSLSRNSLHDGQLDKPLSISTKDLRTFVSSTYSPSDENMIDDNGIVHRRQGRSTEEELAFKRQARLSKSFHNVSEYNSTDQYPKKETHLASRPPPSKSVENDLNRVSQPAVPARQTSRILNFPPMVASTSFSALPPAEDNARMLVRWSRPSYVLERVSEKDFELERVSNESGTVKCFPKARWPLLKNYTEEIFSIW